MSLVFKEKRRTNFQTDDLVFKVFKVCSNTANSVQGTVNTYYWSSVFEEIRRAHFERDDLVFKVFKDCLNTANNVQGPVNTYY